MKNYLNLAQKILDNGSDRMDRTGVGCRSLFGEQLRFDLSKGFPLLTTKKVFWRGVVVELLWMLSGSTNIKPLQEQGVDIWGHWRRPYTRDRDIVLIPVRQAVPAPRYDGFYSTAGASNDKLAEVWKRMMRRCYDPSFDKFTSYGAKCTTVHPKWHDVEEFIKDAPTLPHWWYKTKDWSGVDLDKDYYNANQYGPETSVWLRHDENTSYMSTATPLLAVAPNGDQYTFVCAADCARHMSIPTSSLDRFVDSGPLKRLKGNNKGLIGWAFRTISTENHVVRLALMDDGDLGPVYGKQWRDFNGVDQISDLVKNLKHNPGGRRHIVTAWNPSEIPNMALPPCHCFFQCFVANGKLSLCLHQRSADFLLGIPFNIASYALLTHMLAQVCGYQVGEFIHNFGDVHLYHNHFDQIREQLTREPRVLPRLTLNPDVNSIFDFKLEDIQLLEYNPWPPIKAEVAV